MTDIAVCAVAIKKMEGNDMQLYYFCHYDLTSSRQNFICLSICLSWVSLSMAEEMSSRFNSKYSLTILN